MGLGEIPLLVLASFLLSGAANYYVPQEIYQFQKDGEEQIPIEDEAIDEIKDTNEDKNASSIDITKDAINIEDAVFVAF